MVTITPNPMYFIWQKQNTGLGFTTIWKALTPRCSDQVILDPTLKSRFNIKETCQITLLYVVIWVRVLFIFNGTPSHCSSAVQALQRTPPDNNVLPEEFIFILCPFLYVGNPLKMNAL